MQTKKVKVSGRKITLKIHAFLIFKKITRGLRKKIIYLWRRGKHKRIKEENHCP